MTTCQTVVFPCKDPKRGTKKYSRVDYIMLFKSMNLSNSYEESLSGDETKIKDSELDYPSDNKTIQELGQI